MIPVEMEIHRTRAACGRAAAEYGAKRIREALRAQGYARLIVATGASQFEMLKELVAQPDIDWSRITVFHLDEYVGLPISHPASFRQYLWTRFVSKLPLPLAAFHYLNAEENPEAECLRVGKLIKTAPIDVAFVGIGENGHLAFNDPPADFKTKKPYLVVELDTACRKQQLGEGWFATLQKVPRKAISMSINQIMASHAIVCTVPDARKAMAVKDCLVGDVSNLHPASILRQHPDTRFFLDKPAASLIQ